MECKSEKLKEWKRKAAQFETDIDCARIYGPEFCLKIADAQQKFIMEMLEGIKNQWME